MPGPYTSNDERNYLGFGRQTAKGTGVAPTVFLPYAGAIDADHGMDGDDVREAGAGVYVARSRKTKHDPKGTAEMAARPSTAAKLIAWFLGADAISGVGPYTHVLTPATTNTWVSAERCQADEIIERFVDGQISKVTLSGEGGADLMVGLEWSALTPSWQGTATTEIYEAVDPFQQDEATYTVDGAAATNLASWRAELAWELDADVRLSKVTRDQLPKLRVVGTLTLKQLMLDTLDYRKVNLGSTTGTAANKDFFNTGAFIATYDNGAAGAAQRQIKLELPKVSWRTAKFTQPNPDGETTYLERTGVVTKTTPDTVKVTAITSDATGYLV